MDHLKKEKHYQKQMCQYMPRGTALRVFPAQQETQSPNNLYLKITRVEV